MVLIAFAIATAFAERQGVRFRRWAWDYTRHVHFFRDINNGYHWGTQGNQPTENPRGVLNVYDDVAAQSGRSAAPEYELDYAPLRLLLITRWVRWTEIHHRELAAAAHVTSADGPSARNFDTPYEFFAPLLDFNTGMEIFGAVGIFLLTRHWVVRRERMERLAARASSEITCGWRACWIALRERFTAWLDSPRPFRGWSAGFIAAMLFWFNPAIVLSAHGWPTWDMWVIPFFIWAVYLASIDCWFIAGLMIAVGAMFKGQQLFVAPMFILWPLFIARPGKALRWAIGLVFGVAIIALPWMLTYVPGATRFAAGRVIDRPAIVWLAGVVITSIALPFLLRRFRPWRARAESRAIAWSIWGGLVLLAVTLCVWPFLLAGNRDAWWAGLLLAAVLIAAGQWLPVKRLALLVAGSLGTSILLCALLFQGNMNWMNVGWLYGTRHYYKMTMGVSDNLAGILHERYDWNNLDATAYKVDAHPTRLWPTHRILLAEPTAVSLRQLLVAIYVVTFLISVVGVALQYRRNDPRFLIAICAPWLMFFTFMPQIHERYLIYAAGIGCCLTAVSLGATLLNLFLTTLTAGMTLHVMLNTAINRNYVHDFGNNVSVTFKHTLLRCLQQSYPDAGWAVMLCAGIFLYLAVMPTPRKRAALMRAI